MRILLAGNSVDWLTGSIRIFPSECRSIFLVGDFNSLIPGCKLLSSFRVVVTQGWKINYYVCMDNQNSQQISWIRKLDWKKNIINTWSVSMIFQTWIFGFKILQMPVNQSGNQVATWECLDGIISRVTVIGKSLHMNKILVLWLWNG